LNTKRTTLVLAALLWAAAATLAVNEARADVVDAWGYNVYGQLGDGTTTTRSTPAPVSGLSSGVIAIAAGLNHSLAVQNGRAYTWGYNQDGELGDGTGIDRSTPVAVTSLTSGVTAIDAGGLYSLALQNGSVYAWGSNGAGQLGNGTTTGSFTPVAVTGLASGVTAIAAGGAHGLASRVRRDLPARIYANKKPTWPTT
jgi:alpha-tubulin suppressor-like RCC1 family protein